MTKISLITASWNSAATIGDTLASVAAQTYPDIEHLLIDGGSTDSTMEVVAEKGKHVAKVVSERDRGIFDAYNKGLKLATGEVIGFLNADDFYASDTVIAEAMQAFEDPSVDAVHAELVYVDTDDTSKIVRHWRSRKCSLLNIRRGFHPAHPTLFLRRSVYEKAGGFDPDYRLAGDVEFMLRIFYAHRVKDRYIPKIWVRMRTGGATGGSVLSIRRQNLEVRRAQSHVGIRYPLAGFLAFKIYDRLLQRLRAPFVRLPSGRTA